MIFPRGFGPACLILGLISSDYVLLRLGWNTICGSGKVKKKQ
jgi:hypothetical protein